MPGADIRAFHRSVRLSFNAITGTMFLLAASSMGVAIVGLMPGDVGDVGRRLATAVLFVLSIILLFIALRAASPGGEG